MRVGRVGGGLHERAEPVQQGGGSRPVPRAALQAGHDQAGQLGGQGGQVGLLGGQFDQHVHDRVALVGPMPSRGEQQGGAERVDVTGRRGVLGVAGLLGGHVGGCADGAAGGGQLHALGGAGHPEVDDPRAIRRHQDIGRLEVAVYQAGQVNGLQRLRTAGREPEHARHRQRTAHPHQLAQRRGGHVGRRQPGHLGLGVGRDHSRGEHPADPACGGDLPSEAGPEAGFLSQLDLDRLDRDQAACGGPAQVHLAHRPGPQTAE